MKVFFFFLIFFALSSSNLVLNDPLGQEVGETCSQNPNYLISSFDVSPYPPGIGVTFSIVMQGTFNAAESIGNIQVGLQVNQRWYYNYASVYKDFQQGQNATLRADATVPTTRGNWLGQVTVHKKNSQEYVSCWQFNFSN